MSDILKIVMENSKYTDEEFVDWFLNDSKISLGGNNATIFLEKMYRKEVNENGRTSS